MDTNDKNQKGFTVIEGGKSDNAGESHDSNFRIAKASEVCKGGLLIDFAGTSFEKLDGVAHINAGIYPELLVLALIKAAMDHQHNMN